MGLITSIDPNLISLHKHWCQADAVKQFIYADIKEGKATGLPEWLEDLGNKSSQMSRLCIWYALLYVIIEGFKELKLSYPEVDECLNNEEYVNYLRRFRNAVFHYQKDPFSEKIMQFLEAKESEIWIRKLNEAFEKYFLENLPIKEDTEKIKSLI